ncbi:MAG: PEP-CTERM sorting domain-containing protein [Phycisphaerales bacterium]|nr:MAG: PEP-CTERM sorting domain-containing protein [Phycisphaerales bacterium]
MMMKKLFVLMLVVSLATAASAGLKISVNGVVDPAETEVTLKVGETAVIDIWGDGDTPSPESGWLTVQGPGLIAGGEMLYAADGGLSYYQDLEQMADELGMPAAELLAVMATSLEVPDAVDVSYSVLADSKVPARALEGTLVDGIGFTCTDLGDVILTLFSGNDLTNGVVTVLDTQVIHQIPEPMTVALLGLGGLFLRRRK